MDHGTTSNLAKLRSIKFNAKSKPKAEKLHLSENQQEKLFWRFLSTKEKMWVFLDYVLKYDDNYITELILIYQILVLQQYINDMHQTPPHHHFKHICHCMNYWI